MILVSYFSLLAAILSISLGIYIFSLNPRKNTNRLFAVLVIFTSIFSIGEFMVRLSETQEAALVAGRICYSVFPIVSCAVVHFASIFPRKFPNEKNIFTKYKYSIIPLYVISIIMGIIFNILVSTQDVQMTEWGYRVLLSRSTVFVIFFFLFCGFYTLFSSLHKYHNKNISDLEKKQVKFLLIGLLLIFALSLGTNLIPPLFSLSIFPMTSISLLLFSVMVAYSILKYELLKLTPAETADVVMDTMADSLIVVDRDENIVNVNRSTLNFLGYNKKELINSSLKRVINLSKIEKKDYKKVFESKVVGELFTDNSDGKLKNIEVEFVTKEGKFVPMNISVSIIYDSRKNIEGIVLIARDLTEIKKSLKEKEVLLREIHHRVKNNLQLISSLLDLQSEQIENKDVMEMFRESQNRIKLMASLHEQLYQSKNLAKINFGEYVQSLITNLFYSYKINPNVVSLEVNIPDIFMDVDTTLACSLIVNELVSNSLKHAFPSGEKGEIIIDLRLEDNTYILAVSDTGVGFPKDVDFRNTKTLGLQLVNIFVQQLKGNIKLDRIGGTKFIITFGYIRRKKKGAERW